MQSVTLSRLLPTTASDAVDVLKGPVLKKKNETSFEVTGTLECL